MPLRRLSQALPRPGQYAPIGAMNKQVTFYSPGAKSAATGQAGPALAAFACWAAIYALAGDELDKAQQIAQKTSHLVVINYQFGLENNMTLQYLDAGATRVFQVADVNDPDEQRWQL